MHTPLFTTIEALEPRIAPAAIFTFTENDGDSVTVKTSKGSNAKLMAAVLLDQNDFLEIRLTDPVFAKTNLTVTVKQAGLGDGKVMVDRLEAFGNDLGVVKIAGDLGSFAAGDAKGNTPGLVSLTVENLQSDLGLGGVVVGKLGSLVVRGSFLNNSITVSDGLYDGVLSAEWVAKKWTPNIGKVSIGGDLIAGNIDRDYVGSIRAEGKIGSVSIKGNLTGNDLDYSGYIYGLTGLGTITVGKTVSGSGGVRSGTFESGAKIGIVKVGDRLIGGLGDDSGEIIANGNVTSISIGANNDFEDALIGSNGFNAGRIFAAGKIGTLTLHGNLQGGAAQNSGQIYTSLGLGKVTVKGNVLGVADLDGGVNSNNSGAITTSGAFGSIFVTGRVEAQGTQTYAMIGSDTTLGPVNIKGALVHATIAAAGRPGLNTTTDLAIAKVTIGGDVMSSNILGGYTNALAAVNPDASLGAIVIKGHLAGNIAAGIELLGQFNVADDRPIVATANFPDSERIVSRIASVTVKQVGVCSIDAQKLGKVKFADFHFPLNVYTNPNGVQIISYP